MARRNFHGLQINSTPTIVRPAGANIDDVRNKILAYDNNKKLVLATAGTAMPVGIAIIEAGYNDISGATSGKVVSGEDVTVQIKDIGYVIAGEAIAEGQEVTAMAGGLAAVAADGDYVLGRALNSVSADGYCEIQISKYQKNPTAAS